MSSTIIVTGALGTAAFVRQVGRLRYLNVLSPTGGGVVINLDGGVKGPANGRLLVGLATSVSHHFQDTQKRPWSFSASGTVASGSWCAVFEV